MLTVIDHSLHFVDLFKMSVCNINNRDYMAAKCDLCPGFLETKTYLTEFMVKQYCKDEKINFMQWEKVDRSNLVGCNLDFHDFLMM